eukprot:2653559-Rhodomonas_salina.1
MTRTRMPGSKMIANDLALHFLQHHTLVSRKTGNKNTTSVSVNDLEDRMVTHSKATRTIKDRILRGGLPLGAEREAKNRGADLSQLTVAVIAADVDQGPRNAGCATMNIRVAITETVRIATPSTL